ncbi:MAG: site-2 protease family protein [Planctomycetota bacterium]|jgi:Zn-dependent protease
MSFDQRDYSRSSDGRGGAPGDALRRLGEALNLSFPIGTYLDIRVRVHITFLIVLVIYLITQGDPLWTIRWSSLLFLSVLLHEFGHCLACRAVGGQANEILMWPLGGLAFCMPPRRPWPEFVTVIWGPMVNLIIATLSYGALLLWWGGGVPVSLNPFRLFVADPGGGVMGLVADLFVVNYVLMLFNLLLIFFPFDGGRLVQIALWTKLGYVRSLSFACSFGMGGAVLTALVGLAMTNFLLVGIAVFGFVSCYQQKRYLRTAHSYGMDLGLEEEPWSTPPPRPGMLARWRAQRSDRAEQRRADRQRHERQEVDRILDKVHNDGLASLTGREKKLLRQATDRQRDR